MGDDNDDLTSLDDLGEFTHEDDPEVDEQLQEVSDESAPPVPPPLEEDDFEEVDQEVGEATEYGVTQEQWGQEDEADSEAEPEVDQFAQETASELAAAEEEVLGEALEEVPEEVLEEFPEVVPVEGEDTGKSGVEGENEAAKSSPSRDRESFKDVREFGQAFTQGAVVTEGNPPFSVIVRDIKFIEDAEDILAVLKEQGICNDGNEAQFKTGLDNGAIIIPRVGEYVAISLAHRLRRFDVNLQIGLSDEVYPAKSYVREERGLVSKHNLHQNVEQEVSLIPESPKQDSSDIDDKE